MPLHDPTDSAKNYWPTAENVNLNPLLPTLDISLLVAVGRGHPG